MLWTVCMLFMFAWMLALIFQFRLDAIPLVIVLTTIMAFIKLTGRTFQLRKSAAHEAGKFN
jgi:hypothetical protein